LYINEPLQDIQNIVQGQYTSLDMVEPIQQISKNISSIESSLQFSDYAEVQQFKQLILGELVIEKANDLLQCSKNERKIRLSKIMMK